MANISNVPSIPESHKDLLTAPVAVLATNGTDGFPQVSALWFLYEEDAGLQLSLNTTRQKFKNMQERPEVTLFILDPANPYRTIEIRARAEIKPDTNGAFATKLGDKYGGFDVRGNDKPGESRIVVTLHPVKVNVWG